MTDPTYNFDPVINPFKGDNFLRVGLHELADGTFVNVSPAAPMPIASGGAQLDAFGRQRVSNTGNRLDVEFIYDKQSDLFDEITVNGTVTHNTNERDLTLALTSAVDGNIASMCSHPVPYTPGNSQLIDVTGVLDLADIGTGTVEAFLRSSVTGSIVETVVAQEAWIAKASGVDWATSHIFQIDFQSLKVGTIRFNMVADGLPINVTQINNDGRMASGYWQLPTLPVMWRLYIDGTETKMEIGYGDADNAVGFRYTLPTANASATMKAICCTVKSEGGTDIANLAGLPRAVDTGTTTVSVNSSTNLIPLLSLRSGPTYKSLSNRGLIIPKNFAVFTNQDVRVVEILGGTLTGESWVDVNTADTPAQYDISATAITGGHILSSEFFSATSGNNNNSSQGALLGKTPIWARQGTETGILTIAAVHLGTNATCRSSIKWEDIR